MTGKLELHLSQSKKVFQQPTVQREARLFKTFKPFKMFKSFRK